MLERDDVPAAECQRQPPQQVDPVLHQRGESTRAAAVHIAAQHRLQLRSGRHLRSPVQPPAVPGLSGAAGRGLLAAADRHARPRHLLQHTHNTNVLGIDFVSGERGNRRQPVHQLLVEDPPRRGLPLRTERRHEAAEQPAGAKLLTKLHQTSALPPGASRVLLEDLRLQQEVFVLRAEELGRAGHSGADSLPPERFASGSM